MASRVSLQENGKKTQADQAITTPARVVHPSSCACAQRATKAKSTKLSSSWGRTTKRPRSPHQHKDARREATGLTSPTRCKPAGCKADPCLHARACPPAQKAEPS